ncbi:hypothetical protein DYP60_09775 [Sphaerochaeta halotolerans]|uniref:Capsule assembly Wzi family protein n=1 Tax=Sphaerochaeta halotolerans TaxID=2293840 RepID=A0A372MFB7_9SPIR|nr:hypothetical protein [Sphaerochaeta halotolerans]RFU94477.1 hypothetical protein DYP60_09775 [Sphaerochaeta halotolerans]
MKYRIAVLMILVCIGIFPLAAVSPAQIPLSSPIYEEIDLLYQLSGRALPSTSRPWNTYEALAILKAIEEDNSYQDLWDTAYQRMEGPSFHQVDETFSYRISPTINLESYVHTNDQDFTSYDDWIYSYDERKPFLDLTLSMQFSSSFLFETSLQAGVGAYIEDVDPEGEIETWGIGVILDQGDAFLVPDATLYRRTFSSNLPFFGSPMEPDFPRHSQMTYAGPWWAISLGRGAYSWGAGKSGNLVVGDHISNHTGLTASFFNQKFKAQLLYLFFPDVSQSGKSPRIFLAHRFEFNPASWARISISENVMANQNGLSLQYVDPTYIYHNIFDPPQVNSIASIEADITPLPGFSIHGQFALDQFQLSSEGAATANALAFLVSGSYSWDAQKGYFTFGLEAASTDPAMYRREYVDFLVARDLFKQDDSLPVIIDYLGYSWGSDSKVYQARLNYLLPGKVNLEASLTIHRQGELDYLAAHHVAESSSTNDKYPNISGPSPSGDTITERLIVGFGGTYYTDIPNLELFGQVNWIGKREFDRPSGSASGYADDFQVIFGITKRF